MIMVCSVVFVDSSMTMSLDCLRIARARQSNCLSLNIKHISDPCVQLVNKQDLPYAKFCASFSGNVIEIAKRSGVSIQVYAADGAKLYQRNDQILIVAIIRHHRILTISASLNCPNSSSIKRTVPPTIDGFSA